MGWLNPPMLCKTRKAHQTFIFEDMRGELSKVSKCASRKYTTQVVTSASIVPFVVAKFRRNLRKIKLTNGQYERLERAMSVVIASKRLELVHFSGKASVSVVKRIRVFGMLKDLKMRIPSNIFGQYPNLFQEFRYIQKLNLQVGPIEVTGTGEDRRVLQFFKNLSRLIDLKILDIAIDSLPENLLDAILSIIGNIPGSKIRIKAPMDKIDIEQTKEYFSKLDFLTLKTEPRGQLSACIEAMQKSQKVGEFSLENISVSSLSQIFENSINLKTLCLETMRFLASFHSKHQNMRCWKGLKNLTVRTKRGFGPEDSLGDCFSGLYNFLSEVTGLNNILFEVSLTDKESIERFFKLHQLKCVKSVQSYTLTHNGLIGFAPAQRWTDLFEELSSFSYLKSLNLNIRFESSCLLLFLKHLLLRLTNLEGLILNICYQSLNTRDREEIDFSIPFDSLPELRMFRLHLSPDLSVTGSQSILEGLGKLRKIHTIEISGNCLRRCPVKFLKTTITQIFNLKSVKKMDILGKKLEKPEGEELSRDSFFSF